MNMEILVEQFFMMLIVNEIYLLLQFVEFFFLGFQRQVDYSGRDMLVFGIGLEFFFFEVIRFQFFKVYDMKVIG